MTNRRFIASLVTFLWLQGGMIFSSEQANATEQKFFCGQRDGVPTTMALTSHGAVPVIRWVSGLGDGEYSPEARCQMVSERFQRYYDAGQLNYLTTGTENGYAVICVTDSRGGDCTGTLFTLKPGSNPDQTLQNLFGVRDSIGPLNESSPRVYVNLAETLGGEAHFSTDSLNRPSKDTWGMGTPTENTNSDNLPW